MMCGNIRRHFLEGIGELRRYFPIVFRFTLSRMSSKSQFQHLLAREITVKDMYSERGEDAPNKQAIESPGASHLASRAILAPGVSQRSSQVPPEPKTSKIFRPISNFHVRQYIDTCLGAGGIRRKLLFFLFFPSFPKQQPILLGLGPIPMNSSSIIPTSSSTLFHRSAYLVFFFMNNFPPASEALAFQARRLQLIGFSSRNCETEPDTTS